MPAGRPLKFKSVKELHSTVVKDGEVLIVDSDNIINNQFETEKKLSDFIIENIKEFTKDILGDEMVSFCRDQSIQKRLKFGPRKRRVDLIVYGKNKTYIIELKNPKYKALNRYAIGQILDYGKEFLDSKKELVIITTFFDIDTAETISHYNLPIRYIYFQKDKSLEYLGNAGEC